MDFKKYYERAVAYLTIRPRSEFELKNYLILKSKKLHIDMDEAMPFIDTVIDALKEQKYLDDEKFIIWYKDQRDRIRSRSDMLIKYELIKRGVDKNLIDDVFEKLDEKVTDDEKAALSAQKYYKKLSSYPKEEQVNKLLGYLGRRGFNYTVSRRAIDDIYSKSYNRDR